VPVTCDRFLPSDGYPYARSRSVVPVDDLEQAERDLLEALQRGDSAASADFLRDDFLITTAGWMAKPVGKREWLDALAGPMTLEEFDLRLLATQRYGDVSVVLAESSQQGSHDGRPYSMTFRYTDVWVYDTDRWRLATRHASAVPPP
jgi:ketosteroid isomerase-like protein